ncbi:hypothetical protein CAPTEDRAFT_27777, partial [Capitella teleta]
RVTIAFFGMFSGLTNLFGNSLTIIAVLRFKQLRDVISNRFIISLSAGDLLCVPGFTILPMTIYITPTATVGRIWGLVIQIPIILSFWISGLTLVAISIDRVIAVSKPMMYRRIMTKRMAWLMIAIVWVLIIGGMAPALLYFSLN